VGTVLNVTKNPEKRNSGTADTGAKNTAAYINQI